MNRSKLLLLKTLVIVAITTTGVSTMHAQSGSKREAVKSPMSRAYLNNNNIPSSGVALEGYCPVAYFAVNKPVKGQARFASTYKGVTYHFVNDDARAAFERTPDKYVPAFGGWCALGMAMGDKFPVDPTSFKIVNGRLNLFLKNRNVDALALWNRGDEAEQTAKARAHWAQVNR